MDTAGSDGDNSGQITKFKNAVQYSGSWDVSVLYNTVDATLAAHREASLKLAQKSRLHKEATSSWMYLF